MVRLGHVVIRHQRKDVVKVRLHVAGVKVHDDGSVRVFRVCVVVHKYDDHDVVTYVSLPLQLDHNHEKILILPKYHVQRSIKLVLSLKAKSIRQKNQYNYLISQFLIS